MEKIKTETLETIYGGNTSITGPIITGLVSIIKILKEAGYSLGSGIRRISETNLCPLK
jgi:hypothetical protein